MNLDIKTGIEIRIAISLILFCIEGGILFVSLIWIYFFLIAAPKIEKEAKINKEVTRQNFKLL